MNDKGPRFSVPSMPDIGEAMNQIVTWVESLKEPKQIVAGPNIQISEDEDSYCITGQPGGTGSTNTEVCPLDPIVTAVEDVDNRWEVSVRLGTIGGMCPENWYDIGILRGGQSQFIVAEIDAYEKSIQAVTLKLKEDCNTCIPAEEGQPPQTFSILIAGLIFPDDRPDDGIWGPPAIYRAISCGSVEILAHSIDGTCYTWDVNII